MFDESDNELSVIPSYKIHEALIELSGDYLEEVLGYIEIEKDMREEIEIFKHSFGEIFEYGNVEEKINQAENTFMYLHQCTERLDIETRKKCEKLLGWLAYLVNIQRHYVPFVELKEPFPPKKHRTINCMIDRPSKLEKSPLFRIDGHMEHLFALKIGFVTSYHLEIIPPDGIDIQNFEFRDLENTQIMENKKKKDDYFDGRLLYISFSPEETKEIHKKIDEGKAPALNLFMRVNPLLRWLFRLVQVAIISPLLSMILVGSVGMSEFIASLTLGATIFVSASIYAIDKKFVQEFALFQLLITLILLFLELVLFIFF